MCLGQLQNILLTKTTVVKMSYQFNFGYVNAHYHQFKSHAVARSLYHIVLMDSFSFAGKTLEGHAQL